MPHTLDSGTALHYAVARAVRESHYDRAYDALGRAYPTMPISDAVALVADLVRSITREEESRIAESRIDPW